MRNATKEQHSAPNFPEILANCVHDLKNSAAIVIHAAQAIQNSNAQSDLDPQMVVLQSEAQRINHDLLHLLGYYKLENSKQGILREIVDCEDLLIEVRDYNKPLMQARGIDFEVQVEGAVEGYFDRQLVTSILNASINNAQRHAKHQVRVNCETRDGFTVFSVADDGIGFSNEILANTDFEAGRTVSCTNSTGLGFYFADRIVKLHRHRDRIGRISLANNSPLGGGVFSLWLP